MNTDEGFSALHFAAFRGNIDIIKILLVINVFYNNRNMERI